MKDAKKKNGQLDTCRIESFSTMMGQLDTDVKLAIMATEGWGLVEAGKDVVGLLDRLVATHGVLPSSEHRSGMSQTSMPTASSDTWRALLII